MDCALVHKTSSAVWDWLEDPQGFTETAPIAMVGGRKSGQIEKCGLGSEFTQEKCAHVRPER